MRHKEQARDEYTKVFGRDPSWEVFKFNFLKMLCVNLLSKAFMLMIITGLCAMVIIFWTILYSQAPLSWLTYLVILAPPVFFGLWWIEKQRAEIFMDAVSSWIASKKR